MNRKIKILYCLVFFAIVELVLVYYRGYQGLFNNELFWLGILISGACTFIMIADKNISIKDKLTFLFLYGIIIFLPSLLWSPNHFQFGDEIGQDRVTELISTHGGTDFAPIFPLPSEIIRYYSGLPFVAVILDDISGTSNTFYVAKLTIALIHSFLLIIIYIFFKYISTERIAILGALIYTVNINYSFFNSLFVYESLGLLLFLLTILAFAKFEESNGWRVVFVIAIGSLTIVHHFSSYLALIFLLILLTVTAKKKENIVDIKKATLLLVASISFYIIYSATITLKYFGGTFGRLEDKILGIMTEIFSETGQNYMLDKIPVPKYELIVSKYFYAPVILLLFLIGYYLLKNKNKYTYTMAIFGFLAFFVPVLFMRNFGDLGRVLTFGFFGISFFVAVSIDHMLHNQNSGSIKIIALVLFILLVMGSVSIGDKSPTRQPSILSGITASGDSTATTDTFYAGSWLKDKNSNETTYGDKMISTVFNRYGIFVEYANDSSKVFNSYPMDFATLRRNYFIAKVTIDRRITKLMPTGLSYFATDEIVLSPLSAKVLEKFDDDYLFVKTYTNGNIDIYDMTADMSLWQHVYSPIDRLEIVDARRTINGVVMSIEEEPDGDYHVNVKLDQQYSNLLNKQNIDLQKGYLVTEPICSHSTKDPDAINSCEGFTQNFKVYVGEHIQMTGAYVKDIGESGWMEIHPIMSIKQIQ